MLMIDRSDVIVRLEDMPTRLKGFTSPSPDGTYNIYLNARLTYKSMLEAYRHELRHIECGDLEADIPVEVLEVD